MSAYLVSSSSGLKFRYVIREFPGYRSEGYHEYLKQWAGEADLFLMSKPVLISRHEHRLFHSRLLRCLLAYAGAALIVILCSGSISAATLQLNLVSPDVVEQRLQAGAVSASKRQETIQKLFAAVGCSPEEQTIRKKQANVICTLPGETNDTIIVGGHFDFAERGQGIVDDWSGTALLPSLYQALKNKRRHFTIRFVAFAAEEKGLVGSTYYVKAANPEQLGSIKAFINLECLGLTPPKVWVHRSTPLLVHQLLAVANATKTPLQGVDVDRIGDDDTHPFAAHKVPVVSIHSLTQETLGVLHSNRDTLDAVQRQNYYDAYKLVAFYVAYLDQSLGSAP